MPSKNIPHVVVSTVAKIDVGSENLLTTGEVAKRLNCHRATVQRLLESGRLLGFSIHTRGRKNWRIPQSSLNNLLAAESTQKPVSCPEIVSDPFPLLRKYSKKLRGES